MDPYLLFIRLGILLALLRALGLFRIVCISHLDILSIFIDNIHALPLVLLRILFGLRGGLGLLLLNLLVQRTLMVGQQGLEVVKVVAFRGHSVSLQKHLGLALLRDILARFGIDGGQARVLDPSTIRSNVSPE